MAALAAFALWCVVFVGMVLGSILEGKSPTLRWLALFGPLLVVFGADHILNSQWHSQKWTSVERNPEFYVGLGVLAFVLSIVVTAVGLSRWSLSPWFQ